MCDVEIDRLNRKYCLGFDQIDIGMKIANDECLGVKQSGYPNQTMLRRLNPKCQHLKKSRTTYIISK